MAASVTLYTYNSALSWSSSSSVTSETKEEDTTVTNSSGGDVYFWDGVGNSPTGGGTQLTAVNNTFYQADDDKTWSFSDSDGGGVPAQVSLTLAGKGGE